jgi:hypothetical protein
MLAAAWTPGPKTRPGVTELTVAGKIYGFPPFRQKKGERMGHGAANGREKEKCCKYMLKRLAKLYIVKKLRELAASELPATHSRNFVRVNAIE